MPEFSRRWDKFSPEPLENGVPQVPEGTYVTSGTPSGEGSGEKIT